MSSANDILLHIWKWKLVNLAYLTNEHTPSLCRGQFQQCWKTMWCWGQNPRSPHEKPALKLFELPLWSDKLDTFLNLIKKYKIVCVTCKESWHWDLTSLCDLLICLGLPHKNIAVHIAVLSESGIFRQG